ncbi:MAG: DUF1848 family protein [Candidatus Zixiibacteriota bacterium]
MNEKRYLKKVISASRRVDLVAFYPDFMAQRLEEIGTDSIHTLVIWTKNPENMLAHPGLNVVLKKISQLYLLLTVTGLGGTALEPAAPKAEQVFEQLPRIIDFIESPQRLAIRYDPLIDVTYEDTIRISNIDLDTFGDVLNRAHGLGVKRIIVSCVTVYPKVENRLRQNGFRLVDRPIQVAADFIQRQMIPRTEELGMELSTCVLPHLTGKGCIDGKTLTELHPLQEPCPLAKDTSQRENCHCTKSVDVGRWFACYHNCLYCYGNPTRR